MNPSDDSNRTPSPQEILEMLEARDRQKKKQKAVMNSNTPKREKGQPISSDKMSEMPCIARFEGKCTAEFGQCPRSHDILLFQRYATQCIQEASDAGVISVGQALWFLDQIYPYTEHELSPTVAASHQDATDREQQQCEQSPATTAVLSSDIGDQSATAEPDCQEHASSTHAEPQQQLLVDQWPNAISNVATAVVAVLVTAILLSSVGACPRAAPSVGDDEVIESPEAHHWQSLPTLAAVS